MNHDYAFVSKVNNNNNNNKKKKGNLIFPSIFKVKK